MSYEDVSPTRVPKTIPDMWKDRPAPGAGQRPTAPLGGRFRTHPRPAAALCSVWESLAC